MENIKINWKKRGNSTKSWKKYKKIQKYILRETEERWKKISFKLEKFLKMFSKDFGKTN